MSVVKNHDEPLLHRHPSNPILTSRDWPYSINSVFNAGATLLEDGSTLLLCRVEERRGLSHLCAARSANGVDGWQIDPVPTLLPNPAEYPEELWGIEDPRLTYVPELQQYAVVYTSYSRGGPGVSLDLQELFGLALCAASTSSVRTKRLPCLLIAPKCCLPPELCSRGISPR